VTKVTKDKKVIKAIKEILEYRYTNGCNSTVLKCILFFHAYRVFKALPVHKVFREKQVL
jgi:hypothetical protein